MSYDVDSAAARSVLLAPRSPRDLPDVRRQLIAGVNRFGDLRDAILGTEATIPLDRIAAITRNAPFWWVDSDLAAVVDAAADTVPLDTTLAIPMLVEKSAIAFFARPIVRGLSDTDRWHFNAMQWGPCLFEDAQSGDRTAGVLFTLLSIHNGTWGCIGESWWYFGDQLDHRLPTAEGEAGHLTHVQDRRLAAALWLLSSQKGLAETGIEPLYNAARKRAERAFLPTTPVRILRLRGTTGSESKGGEVEWSHRWIVRGHWRQQPCGPGNSGRRPKWISPHIKGPADKPLDTREGVRVL